MQKIAKGIFVTRDDNARYQLRQKNQGEWWLGVLQPDGKYADQEKFFTYREGVQAIERYQKEDKGQPPKSVKKSETYEHEEVVSNKKSRNRRTCGFCSTLNQPDPRHDLCPGTIKNANMDRRDRVWICPCWEEIPEAHPEAHDHRHAA